MYYCKLIHKLNNYDDYLFKNKTEQLFVKNRKSNECYCALCNMPYAI